MSKRKKTALWVIGVVGALLVLPLLFLLLLPTFINLEPARERIHAAISQKVKGDVEYEELDLSFFPRPRVVIHQGSLSIPGKVAGTLESLTVYPKILTLLRGKVRISMLRAEAPEFKMELPERPEEKEERPKPFSFGSIEETVAPVLALVALEVPGLTLVVDKGRLDLSSGTVSVFSFNNIHGRMSLPPDRLEIDLACNSNLWESISVEGRLTPEDFKGDGRIRVKDLKPQVLTNHFLPPGPRRIGDSHLNLDVSFKTDGFEVLQGDVKGSLPLLTLHQANEKLVVKGKSLKGTFHVDGERITVSLTQLDLDHPQLSISGNLRIGETPPRVRLELEAREIDVKSVRETALSLAGSLPIKREILSMAKGGKIPLVTFGTRGNSLTDLGKTENIFVKGSIVGGEAFIQGTHIGFEGVDLDVRDVKGEVAISQGMLEGRNLEARWGNTQVREGMVRSGLKGKDPPFHLEAAIEVDLAQLLPPLKSLVKDETFVKEMARTSDIRGKAVGRVILGESIKSLKAGANVDEFNLSGRYELLPYPLEIKGLKLSYAGDKVDVRSLSGTLGRSSFSQLRARLRLGKEPYLEILSGKSSVLLGEIYPWVSSLEGVNGALKELKSVKGTIAVSNLELKGPLLKPEKWRFRTGGEVEALAMESTLFPGPVRVNRAGFEVTPEEISLADCETVIFDASLRGSGILMGYLEGLQKADFKFQASVGPEAIKWVSDLIDVPPDLRIRAPLSISRAHGVWDKRGETSLLASLTVKDGPNISIDMVLHPEELIIKNLLIKDRNSQASFVLRLKQREFHLDFAGHLEKSTLDKLLTENQILTGRIEGDLEAHILLDHPMRSTAQGKLKGIGLGYPLELRVPLTIENVSLKAKKNTLTVESALITWEDSHLNLGGNVKFGEDGFRFDMDLSADGFEWEKIEGILEEESEERDLEQGTDFWATALEGTLRIKMGYFKYERFTWRPLHAAISFHRGGIELAVTEANVCGISTTGTVKVTPQELILDVNPFCKNQELNPTLVCLWDKEAFVSGNFDLQGRLSGRGKPEEIVQALRGDLEFLAREGRIYRGRVFSRVLGLLNTTEIFRRRLPESGREGLAYESIRAKGTLQHGKLMLEEWVLDGPSVEIICEGEIDLIGEKIDLRVLVAPLKTVDSAVKKIPLVRDILKGTLVAIPVRVRGDLSNPSVRLASPSAVGSLTGIMKKTFGLPVRVIQPGRPEGEESP
jgi:hypothetical protein